MLNDREFEHWCQRIGLSEETHQLIGQIRSSEPSRRVQSGRGNVAGHYPSRKMGVTIQFESHRHELARIYELEHDPEVLEYYDQPPAIELCYESVNGRRNRHRYTPDFFVIRTHTAGWEECKAEEDLEQLAEKQPHRYCRTPQDEWQCPPAEAYAQRWQLTFRVWSSQQVNWTLQQNWTWLEDYFSPHTPQVSQDVSERVNTLIEAHPGIQLIAILQQLSDVSPDEIYTLIAHEQIYVNLKTAPLSQPQQVQVFLDATIAKAHENMTVVTAPPFVQPIPAIAIQVGTPVIWDSESWEIVNTGQTKIGLLKSDSTFIELPNAAFDALLQNGQITATEVPSALTPVPTPLQTARRQDIEEANHRYELLSPYLSNSPPVGTTRTIRRWLVAYRRAESLYGSGYLGLLPHHTTKGNRTARLDEQVVPFMQHYIQEQYETLKHRGQLRVYEAFQVACQAHQPPLIPPSFNRFCEEIHRRDPHEQTLKRAGRRAATDKEPFYWSLELSTPRHGERPLEIVHIDHTQLDLELVSSLMSLNECKWDASQTLQRNLGRPWMTFMVDAYSRRLLAVYLTFEEPSYRACMMALRICVQRFERMPQTIVVDNGKEFHSHYFEQLLAAYVCTKKHRPPAKARFGSIVERLFGTANTQFVYELKGNTQLMKNPRQVTQSANPKQLAAWTLEQLYQALCEWAYEIYDRREHPALGQSPRAAFELGLTLGGERLHRRVANDELFHILTLPAPIGSTRKVQPGRGIKIHNIYYWCNDFRDPEVEQSSVEVRYDPFDIGIAYAFVRGQWLKCISNYYAQLKGRSEKELQLISAELHQRKRQQGQNAIHSDRELVQFLNSVETTEEQLIIQHIKAIENQRVIQLISGALKQQKDVEQRSQSTAMLSEEHNAVSTDNNETKNRSGNQFINLESEELEYYGEF